MPITVKSASQIEKVAASGRIVARAHQEMERLIAPGITTIELDKAAHSIITSAGGRPSFLGHHGFPASICASVNDQLVHGIPNAKPLEAGDIISIDIGVFMDGYHADSAITYAVGEISPEDAQLIEDTKKSFFAGVELIRQGVRLGDVSAAIGEYVLSRGYGLIREYGGHGIGRKLWEEPHIPNHGTPGTGPLLRAGMVLAIEPMVTRGGEESVVLDDGWTVVMTDGSRTAHYEHTLVVTEDGYRLLTIDA
jgi:methionyl aminopeptidase